MAMLTVKNEINETMVAFKCNFSTIFVYDYWIFELKTTKKTIFEHMELINKYLPLQTKFTIIIVWLCLSFNYAYSIVRTPEVYRIKKIVIDPGHGGKDPGALGKKSMEKDIALSVALKLGEYINKNLPDVEVVFTRKDDVFIGLSERSKIANESGADLFISIHCNSIADKSPYGAETYVMGLHKTQGNLDVAMRENAVITYEEDYTSKYEGYDPNSAESFIIFSLMQNSFLEQSLNLASFIQDEFRERARRKDRGVKQAGFVVLWQNSMPSVLVELGFISNAKEEEYLMSSDGQVHLASAIYRAFKEYKTRVESRSTFTSEKNAISSNEQPKAATSVQNQTPSPSEAERRKAMLKEGIQFKVQITASRNPIPTNSSFFKNIESVEELAVDGLYKYIVGSKLTYSETVEFCQQVKELFPDAFIIAFKDGRPIPLDQARRLSSN
jgi:N-acetylmuramoyl-L-alanine amidase